MVVEDEPDIYDVLLAMFEIWGIEGVAFVDGGEAVAWIDSVDRGEVPGDLPELAILDIRLPEVSGPDIGARLRLSPRLKHMAIVLVTAYRLKPEDEADARARADADLLLYKPLPPMEEFRKTLDDLIAKRKAMAAQQSVIKPITAPPVPVSVEKVEKVAESSHTSAPHRDPIKPPNAEPISDNKIKSPASTGTINTGTINTGTVKPPTAPSLPRTTKPLLPTPPANPSTPPSGSPVVTGNNSGNSSGPAGSSAGTPTPPKPASAPAPSTPPSTPSSASSPTPPASNNPPPKPTQNKPNP